ncbi:uncharacterized protein LOC132758920 [Ruditapes philippinarum]|uniref:uncharacterized protein LOC132758920 n=1 Tax=Ruditapes philippinarum TaxID=129788 RepID=UPI00295C121D|nr:uncharacterized protein LOC132758920 [Ruditapes philippinarum]
MAQNGKWVITRVGYGSSSGQLSYNPEFSYDVWLGKGIPSGDCYQFRGQQAAENFAYKAEELTDTLAVILKNSGAQYLMLERVDYFGSTVLHVAADKTWYIVKDIYSRTNGALYTFNFMFTTTDQDVSKATCSMFVSESDAVTHAASLSGTTTQVAVATTDAKTTAAQTVTTNTPPPSFTQGNSARVIIPHSPRTRATSGHFVESQDMRNKYVGENRLWNITDVNLLQCIRTCLADDKCVSAFFLENSSTCTGHGVIYGSGDVLARVSYYVYS